jgi:lysophospholipase L1-like esterase
MRWPGQLARASGAALAVALTACGGSNPGPGPTQPLPPSITCPANTTVLRLRNEGATVEYPAPTTQNGQAPLSVSCSPPSPSAFSFGTTPVSCDVTDALGRRASCTFQVRIAAAPAMATARLLAFGDSLTSGTTSPDPTALVVHAPDSYPFKLQILLSARYVAQTIDVFNEGCAGEFVDDTSLLCPGGVKRLPDLLRQHTPHAVLLMHGANDLLNYEDAGIPRIVAGLEEMIRIAQRANVRVLVAGLPPQNAAGSRGHGADEVPVLNAEIQKLAQRRDVSFVDLFGQLGGSPTDLIGVDGLHPTVRGYERIAGVWFDAIRQAFETDGGDPTAAAVPLLIIPPPGDR